MKPVSRHSELKNKSRERSSLSVFRLIDFIFYGIIYWAIVMPAPHRPSKSIVKAWTASTTI